MLPETIQQAVNELEAARSAVERKGGSAHERLKAARERLEREINNECSKRFDAGLEAAGRDASAKA